MQTQLGNTTKSLGREYNISTSNHGGDDLLTSYGLRENTLIISSKVDVNLLDVGSYSLFATDSNGDPVRLTYTIQPGKGLYPDPNDTDILRMVIDDSSIMADDGDELYVNKHNIIDCYTLTVNTLEGDTAKRGRIGVVTANLDPGTATSYGITKGDENTTYIDPEIPGVISVNTQNLDKVDDATNTDGIIRHNSEMWRTIEAKDGKLNVLTQNLDKATNEIYGVIKTDDITIRANGAGVVSVLTEGLDHSTPTAYGISKGDEITINSTNGVLSVNTKNLAYATYDEPGIVSVDTYSMTVNEGKIEVNRYNEIESLLEHNNPEHEIFKIDIDDLKNRVSKLETIAMQEVIDFLMPVGDPETVLPQPVFDRETWTVDHYSDRKTISFSIKSNCKFNINVEYKSGTNDYSQVTLLNLRYGDNDSIPANQLANTQFEATGNTVKTIYLTFSVKNYDKDDNIASINTQLIITASSINDSSIKQTSFHIFKCWNNIAFTEEEPAEPAEPEVVIPHESYWFVQPGTESLAIYGNDTKEAEINYGKSGSTNFYFNTLVSASYTYYNESDKEWHSDPYQLNQSSEIGTGKYDIQIITQEVDEDGNAKMSSPSWLNVNISATYNTTRQFNVLNINSNDGLTDVERAAYIYCYLPSTEITLKETTDLVRDKAIEINFKNDATLNREPIKDYKRKSIDKDTLANSISTGKQWAQLDTKEKVNVLNKELEDSESIIHKLSLTLTDQEIEADTDKNTLKGLKANRNLVDKAKEDHNVLSSKNVKEATLSDVLTSDINEYKSVKAELTSLISTNAGKVPTKYNKSLYSSYLTYNSKLAKLSEKIIDEYNKFDELTYLNKESLSTTNNSYIKFFYKESMNLVKPIINVNTSINSVGTSGISYTISRNPSSLMKSDNYNLTLNYSFINKRGDVVNPDGRQNASASETTTINVGTATTVKGTIITSPVTEALSGYRTETTEEMIYYKVIVIDASCVDRKSLWGIGEGNKDSGIIRYGSYNPKTETSLGKIKDDVYAVFKLTGQDANLKNQKFCYYSINLKGKAFGYEEAFCQADSIEFVGISKYKHSRSALQNGIYSPIKIGDNLYITKANLKKSSPSITLSGSSQTDFNTAARSFFGYNHTNYVYDTNKVYVKVANNITGIKVNSITADWQNAFYLEPEITQNVTGSWASTDSSDNGTNANNYTFGNAKISNVTISPWDDISMNINFIITGGTATNIPNGTTITETAISANGKTNFVFLQNSKSYVYTQFYSNYEFSSTPWKNNSCTVTYKLYNNYSTKMNPINSVDALLYDKETDKLLSVYIEDKIKYAEKDNSRDITRSSIPLLSSITGIKFWIGFNTEGITVKTKFESSTSAMGNQVLVNGTYNSPVAKQVAIENALYKNVTVNNNSNNSTFNMDLFNDLVKDYINNTMNNSSSSNSSSSSTSRTSSGGGRAKDKGIANLDLVK